MKIKELLDRLFRKKSINSIVLLGSLVELPTREDIKDEEIAKELDQYKKEYLNILSHKKVFISKDLEDNFMHEVMRNTDLLLRTMQPNQMEELYFLDTDKEEVEQLRHQVSLYKLNTYYETTKQLEQEMILRSVALTEILNETFFLSSFKKNAIKEELNHLGATIQMTRSQRQGITLEASSHLPNVDTTSNSSLKEQKLELLRSTMHAYFPSFREVEGEIKNIATLENKLEVYFYDQEKDILLQEKKQLLTTYSNESEIKLWSMAIYGKDLVTEEDLTQFYEGKFQAWVKEWNGLSHYEDKPCISSQIEKKVYINYMQEQAEALTKMDKHFYSKIVEKKLSDLLMGKLGAYENILPADVTCLAVSRFLKGKKKTFDIPEILNDVRKLLLLLSFEKVGGLEQYFYWNFDGSIFGSTAQQTIDLHEDIMEYKKSLESLYFLEYVDSNAKKPSRFEDNYLYPIYYMLRYILTNKEKYSFRFPEDLRRIDYPGHSTVDVSSSSKRWIKNLRHLVNVKDLAIPPQMAIFYNVFDNMALKDIYFEGENEIVGAFNQCQIEKIHFSDFPEIRYSFSETKIKELCFPFLSLNRMSSREKKKLSHTLFQFYQTNFDYQEQSSQAFPRFERLKIGQGENEVIVTSDKLGYIFDKKIPQYILKEQEDTLLTEGVSTIVEHIIGEEKEKQKIYTKKI